MTQRDLRRSRRIDAILESAVAAFRENGSHGTPMEAIADRLLLTKGSLYYYFRDKEEILFAVHQRALDRLFEELERAEAAGGCPCARLERLVAAHVRIMVEGFHGTALALDFGALSAERLAEVVKRRDRYERALRGLVRQGVREGCLRPVAPRLAGFALLGAINWIARWYRPDGAIGPDELSRSLLDVFFSGLRAAPATHPAAVRTRSNRSRRQA